jgi:hypothetical protein
MPKELLDPKRTPSRMDQLAMGIDCTIHPLVGCCVGQTGGTPGEQARNYLQSLLIAHGQVTPLAPAGPHLTLTATEYQEWLAHLKKWEDAGGTVEMPRAHVNPEFRG